jgi:hypothetical protein
MKSLSVLTLVLVALLAGCGSPWTVVKRPAPSTLAAAKTFTVKPLDFSGVSIDGTPEAAWRAASGDAKSKWWDKDKSVASRNFMRMITSNTKSGRTFTEAGADADAAAPIVVLKLANVRSPDFDLTLQVTTPAGDVIEEATMTLTVRGYGVSEQLRGSGKRMADAVADYIAKQ